MVDTAFALVFQRVLQDRVLIRFGLSESNPAATMEVACSILTNEFGVSEEKAMDWLRSVDANSDENIHIHEIKDHFESNLGIGGLFGEQDTANRVVHGKLLARALEITIRSAAGLVEDGFNISIPRPNLKIAVLGLNPTFSEDDFDTIFATVKGDEGTESESDAITSSQLAAYFEKPWTRGGYHTGQGSKSSKRRAEDVHFNFNVSVIRVGLASRIRLAVGQDQDSIEAIDQAAFVDGFASTFDLPTVTAWQLYYSIDKDESELVEPDELDQAVIDFSWRLYRQT